MVFPDDTQKDIAAVLSAMAGRKLSREEVWKALELPRSTYYNQLEKGTLITADNLRRAATNLGINRAELLTRYRLIEPEEVVSLAARMISSTTEGGPRPLSCPPLRTGGTQTTGTPPKAAIARSPRNLDAPALLVAR